MREDEGDCWVKESVRGRPVWVREDEGEWLMKEECRREESGGWCSLLITFPALVARLSCHRNQAVLDV